MLSSNKNHSLRKFLNSISDYFESISCTFRLLGILRRWVRQQLILSTYIVHSKSHPRFFSCSILTRRRFFYYIMKAFRVVCFRALNSLTFLGFYWYILLSLFYTVVTAAVFFFHMQWFSFPNVEKKYVYITERVSEFQNEEKWNKLENNTKQNKTKQKERLNKQINHLFKMKIANGIFRSDFIADLGARVKMFNVQLFSKFSGAWEAFRILEVK